MNKTQTTLGKYDRRAEVARIEADWAENPRWTGISRPYSAEDVVRLRGSIKRDNTIAKLGAERLSDLLANAEQTRIDAAAFIDAKDALTGGQAVQQVKAGAWAIYLSGCQAAAGHTSEETLHPDRSLYAINSVPSLVRRLNNAFERADQIQWKAGATPDDTGFTDYFAPIIADAEAHTGGALNAYELMKNMIRAGAAGVHFDDRLPSADEVLMPTRDAVQKLTAARLAADVEDVPTLIIAHTTANTTALLSSDCDPRDQAFIHGERTEEGFHRVRAGIEQAIARGLAYAAYADVLWFETAQPDLAAARQFAEAVRRDYPNRRLAYSCAAASERGDAEIARLQRELATLGYRLQFITPAAVRDMRNQPGDMAA